MYLCIFIFFLLFTSISSLSINLDKYNFASLRGEVNTHTVSHVIKTLSKASEYTDELYIYLHTPGGDVQAGLQLINFMKNLQNNNKKVNCVVSVAISMGFVILQHCDTRYGLPYSTYMQHQMALSGVSGELHKINSYIEYINSVEVELDQVQAARLELTPDVFRNKIMNEYWTGTTQAITHKIIDEIATINCRFSIDVEEILYIGQTRIVFSKCPIINTPVEIHGDVKDSIQKMFEIDI